ncbi:hypothetical protein [Fusibacter sp. 3D3]|uniref:hypothetical protein n=1 Tax=Fusibacter sp. 3D3 TaxID=1048380 RepID=UPI000853474A|nr:hypothetical protein [Fusibacter sp. 3D3]GAU79847.1 hypothetical protein F3D3_4512 [Fusibacter sp. 3D3]
MGIRPVDMQMVVHKTEEIHAAKQNVVSKQANELASAQIENKEDTAKKKQTVNTLESKEHNVVKNNKKENEADQKKKKRKKKHLSDEHDQEKEKETIQPTKTQYGKEGTKFDMKV